MKLRVLDLFSGIGGFSLGLERTGGFETVAFCEIEPFPRRVLAKHWPEVPCYDDVRTLTAERLATDGIGVDVITGGFPCQDVSTAGFRAGMDGERTVLYTEIIRLCADIRPQYVIMENVPELLALGFGDVLGALAEIGYDAEWHCIPASVLGASHPRDRVWIIAYPAEGDEAPRKFAGGETLGGWIAGAIQQAGISGFCQHEGKSTRRLGAEPAICRRDDGLSYSMVQDQLSALGNAVVPQIPELIGRAILQAVAA